MSLKYFRWDEIICNFPTGRTVGSAELTFHGLLMSYFFVESFDDIIRLRSKFHLLPNIGWPLRLYFSFSFTWDAEYQIILRSDSYIYLNWFLPQAKMRSQSWWVRFFVQIGLEVNEAAAEKFEQASTKSSYKPSCQVFHLNSFHWQAKSLAFFYFLRCWMPLTNGCFNTT